MRERHSRWNLARIDWRCAGMQAAEIADRALDPRETGDRLHPDRSGRASCRHLDGSARDGSARRTPRSRREGAPASPSGERFKRGGRRGDELADLGDVGEVTQPNRRGHATDGRAPWRSLPALRRSCHPRHGGGRHASVDGGELCAWLTTAARALWQSGSIVQRVSYQLSTPFLVARAVANRWPKIRDQEGPRGTW